MHKTSIAFILLVCTNTTVPQEEPRRAKTHVTQFVRHALKGGLTQQEIYKVKVKEGNEFDYMPGEIIVPFSEEDIFRSTTAHRKEWRAEIKIQEAHMQQIPLAKSFLAFCGATTASALAIRKAHKIGKTKAPFVHMRGHRYKLLFGPVYAGLWYLSTTGLMNVYQQHANGQTFAYILENTKSPAVLRQLAKKYQQSIDPQEQSFAKSCLEQADQLKSERK